MKTLLLLKRNLSSTIIITSPTFIPWKNHFLTRIHGFSTAKAQNPSPNSSYIVQYLVDKCGFSSDEAIKASRGLTHIKSPSRPDSVIRFLKDTGLNDTQITTLLSKRPFTLCASVERTLEPKVKALREMGFSQSELAQLVKIPGSLQSGDLRPKIALLKNLFDNNEDLLKAVRRNNHLLLNSLGKRILPTISLLRGCSIPDCRIAKLVSQAQFINPSKMKASIEHADKLGFSRGSGMFGQAVGILSRISSSTVIAKFGVLTSLGWSEANVLCAVMKHPGLLSISKKKLCAVMKFLTKEAGCELSYIATHPTLLNHSLEKRLVPRFYVTTVLKRHQLIQRECDPYNVAISNEEKFIKKFILPYEVKVPGLREAYIAACNGDVRDQWKT